MKAEMAQLTVDVRNMPEVQWAMRREMARLLRDVADSEQSRPVAARLRAVADAFEAGSSEVV